ncbi:MAG: ISAs1 family transposase, partial [Lachnospiraceae bacterium]|nr:ISAs1 family transposase [Lachnospiraceae bacterium]
DLHNLNEFNVMSTEWGACLSSTRIEEKTNEIPEMQKVIKNLDCRGCIVTADALNAQKETARAIVKGGHGDYCLALKGNQKQAYEEIRGYFACEGLLGEIQDKAGQYQMETEETTYAVVTREYYITDDIQWFEDRGQWEKLQSFGYEKKMITSKETGEAHIEERYYLCSIKPVAELFAIAVRRHWNIENNLHWTLDVVFKEDSLASKEKKAIHNLGLIRRFVLFIIKLMKAYYGRSMRRVRKTIGRRPETELPLVLAVLRVLYTNELLDSIDELTK